MSGVVRRDRGGWALCALVLSLLGACADTGNDRVNVALVAEGTSSASVTTAHGVEVTLSVADLAFGPLYLCASTEAGQACDTARAEWLDSAVIDALGDATTIGALDALSGPYRSFMYDLGISSLLTQDDPRVSDAARSLGDASIVLAGEATVEGVARPFSLVMPIARTGDTEQGVPVVRVRADADSQHTIGARDRSLHIQFDPRPWVRGIDFEALCGSGCDELDPEGQAGRAVRNALTAGQPPTLRWNEEP